MSRFARVAQFRGALIGVALTACVSGCTPNQAGADGAGRSLAASPPVTSSHSPSSVSHDQMQPVPASASASVLSTSASRLEAGQAAKDQTAAGNNPLANRVLFVESDTAAADQVGTWQAQGRADDARQLGKIADRATAIWVSNEPTEVTAQVDEIVSSAAAKSQLPVLVAYDIPNRDCGSFSSGGATTSQQYHDWISRFAAGIKKRPAVVIVEPDAVPSIVGDCAGANPTQRNAQLRDAISVLKATGSATVYLDAGNPSWISDVSRLAGALKQAGVQNADGFSLNVSNFVKTADNVAYGQRISNALGGKTHFVVDTGRNGSGAVAEAEINGGPNWCNPPNRTLGQAPTTNTGQSRVDAFLWVKPPGRSDGDCRPGEPSAGQWWPEYALDLARRSS